jgi:hypothetical protein
MEVVECGTEFACSLHIFYLKLTRFAVNIKLRSH